MSTKSVYYEIEHFSKQIQSCQQSKKQIDYEIGSCQKIQNQQIFQNIPNNKSSSYLIQKVNGQDCHNCQKFKKKILQLQLFSYQVNQLKKKNQDFKEEIQLLTANFLYILELASENIIKGVKANLQKVLEEKQKRIRKQALIIKKLENQSQFLIQKVDAGLQTQQKLEQFQYRVKILQKQNNYLKESLKNVDQNNDQYFQPNSKQPQTNQTKSSKCLQSYQYHFNSIQQRNQYKYIPKDINNVNQLKKLRKLSSLKQKINSIKQKLINQKR